MASETTKLPVSVFGNGPSLARIEFTQAEIEEMLPAKSFDDFLSNFQQESQLQGKASYTQEENKNISVPSLLPSGRQLPKFGLYIFKKGQNNSLVKQ